MENQVIRIHNCKGERPSANNQVSLDIKPNRVRQAYRWIKQWVSRSKKDSNLEIQEISDYKITVKEC